MRRNTRWLAGAGIAALVIAAGTGVAAAGTGSADDEGTDTPITGTDLDRASAAALEHTGGGTVSDTEVGDEEGYYEVEVTLDDGSEVDVHLDRDFAFLSAESDTPGQDD